MVEDVNIYDQIYSPDIVCQKGKTIQKKVKSIVRDQIEIPRELIVKHENITLFMDTLYINELLFLATILKHLYYYTIEWVKNQTSDSYRSVLDNVF